MIANLITLFRIFLLVFILILLDQFSINTHIWAFFLTIFLISLDALDGIVARWRKEESEVGGVLDILVDRIVENCFWIYFASRGIISVWIPIIILSRGLFTDSIRSLALSRGMTAFGEKSLQKSKIGKAIVSSRLSRGLYGFSKILAFLSLIILQSVSITNNEFRIDRNIQYIIGILCYTIIYFTVAFCIVRAIPVFLDSRKYLFTNKN